MPSLARARLVIHEADELSMAERKDLALWLKRLASDLTASKNLFSTRFTARYMRE